MKDGTDEELVADEEMGEGASPAQLRNAAMECDFLGSEWMRLVDISLVVSFVGGITLPMSPTDVCLRSTC